MSVRILVGDCREQMRTLPDDVAWTCAHCGHRNIDRPKETATPICGGCDKETPWEAV